MSTSRILWAGVNHSKNPSVRRVFVAVSRLSAPVAMEMVFLYVIHRSLRLACACLSIKNQSVNRYIELNVGTLAIFIYT